MLRHREHEQLWRIMWYKLLLPSGLGRHTVLICAETFSLHFQWCLAKCKEYRGSQSNEKGTGEFIKQGSKGQLSHKQGPGRETVGKAAWRLKGKQGFLEVVSTQVRTVGSPQKHQKGKRHIPCADGRIAVISIWDGPRCGCIQQSQKQMLQADCGH